MYGENAYETKLRIVRGRWIVTSIWGRKWLRMEEIERMCIVNRTNEV